MKIIIAALVALLVTFLGLGLCGLIDMKYSPASFFIGWLAATAYSITIDILKYKEQNL